MKTSVFPLVKRQFYFYSLFIMCLFTFPNRASAKALYKGITHFECGACPECMQKKSRLWALRCGMQARVQEGVMITLTYDTYKVGSQFEENPTDPTLPLSKRDCQLFIKRLRKHFEPVKIKYLLTAERGKRTHRAHYHALLFGVHFDDLIKYKKSDRGNWIYKSKTLENIWKKGICTVDCINLNAKTARYCTKYCAKDAGNDDTFMLFSRGIGDEELIRKFNGISYWIDGREYSIPKQIWQKKIEEKYSLQGYSKYIPLLHLVNTEKIINNTIERYSKKINKTKDLFEVATLEKGRDQEIKHRFYRLLSSCVSHQRGRRRNELYQYYRDNDYLYKRYLAYWKNKANIFKLTQPSEFERILDLPNEKYRSYKAKSIDAKFRQLKKQSFVPPRSNCHGFDPFHRKKEYKEKSFAPLSRHYRANDTNSTIKELGRTVRRIYLIKETLADPVFDRPVYEFLRQDAKFLRRQSLTNS